MPSMPSCVLSSGKATEGIVNRQKNGYFRRSRAGDLVGSTKYVFIACRKLFVSEHPQLGAESLFDFVERDPSDRLPSKINSRERGHAGSQTSVRILDR